MSAREAVTSEPYALLPRRRPFWLTALTVLVAVVVSGMLSGALVLRLPRQLTASTDIVGYPIFAAYNADRLKDVYYVGILVFPITVLFLYLGLSWIVTRLRNDTPQGKSSVLSGDPLSALPLEGEENASRTLVHAGAWARVATVGAAFGLGGTIAFDATGGVFWVTMTAVTGAYVGLVLIASLFVRRVRGRHRGLVATMSQVNVLAAPLTFIGVVGASAATRITVLSDGSVHHYSWLPLWAAIAIMAAVFGWACLRISRAKTEPAIRDLERRLLLFVVCPVALFLLLSRVPVPGPMDVFHEGESLAASRLTLAGYFPWRDLMSIHGFFQDSVSPLVGMQLLENSRWGADAGRAILLEPLAYVFLLAFMAWLFRRSWVLVLSFGAVILGAKLLPMIGSRFMFLPLVLLLLAVALERRRWWLGVALGCTLAVQAIVVPETAFAVVACGLIVILHDLYHRQPGARLRDAFSLTTWCVVGGGVVIAGFVLLLLSQHALGDFLFYFSLFAPNRALAGGIRPDLPPLGIQSLNRHTLEILSHRRTYLFFVLSTPAALLLAFLYYCASVIRRRPLDTADWVIGAVAIFSLIYYTKFLERADLGHAMQVYAEAVPLIAFLVYRVCRYVDGNLARLRVGARSLSVFGWQPAAVASLLIAALVIPGSGTLRARFAVTPDQIHPAVANAPQISRMGYSQDGIDFATYADVGTVLKAYLRPGDWVFDFSNEPGLYYYLLGQNPRTRYYHVSMAIPEVGQKDLIKQLERDQPKLVVFTNLSLGLPGWDGIPNMVRHYDVSQYILDNYTPLLSTDTQIFYALASANLSSTTAAGLQLSGPAVTTNLPFLGQPCDWGYAPNFLSISPPASTRVNAPITLATAVGEVGFAKVRGWAVDLTTGTPVSKVVVAANGEVIGEGKPAIGRPDVAQFTGKPGTLGSGFAITASIPARVLSLSGGNPFIQVFGVSASGVATELGIGPVAHNGTQLPNSPALSELRLAGGVVPVRLGLSMGEVDWIDAPRYQLEVSPPSGGTWSDYRWLEIDTGAGFRGDAWSLSDVAGADSGHQITFSTLDRSPNHFRVHVGSCAQWHGYAPARLVLTYGNVQDIVAVRLLP